MLDLIGRYGYAAVFVPVFLETAGIPVPGETTLLLAGAAAATGRLDPVLTIVIGAAAAVLGDNVGFAVGRFGGRRLVLRLARVGRVSEGLEWGERFFERHGGKTVFLARWTAGLRIFGAWIAGMTRMPWGRFVVWNALGGVTWAATVVLLGYAFGSSLHLVERVVGLVGALTAGAVLLGVGLLLARRHRRGRSRSRPAQPRIRPPAP